MLSLESVTVRYPARGRGAQPVTAVDSVSLSIGSGEIVGLAGESGCGKSTLARAVVGLHRPSSGAVRLDGIELTGLDRRARRAHRRRAQMVFQDPYGSLDPHRTVRATIAEALAIGHVVARRARDARVDELLERVHLEPGVRRRRPRELSGGQCQRVAIARALAVEPRLLICDEPVTALDVSVQARILDLFAELRDDWGTSCLFITHDLSVLARLADRIAVMHRGRIVEAGPARDLLSNPDHRQTIRLLDAVPRLRQQPSTPSTNGAVPS